MDIVGCLACNLTAGRRPLPGGPILDTDRWRVEHCVGPLGVGTLVLKPRRHIVRVSELTDAEPAHIHYVIQPVSRRQISQSGLHGPRLQAAMFAKPSYPGDEEVAHFAQQARALIAHP